MDFQVIWKEEASRDLQSILDYIAQDIGRLRSTLSMTLLNA
jgi:plasmid stabilization system protein ParE